MTVPEWSSRYRADFLASLVLRPAAGFAEGRPAPCTRRVTSCTERMEQDDPFGELT